MKLDLRTNANTLPGVAKALAKKYRYGLPRDRNYLRMGARGGSVIFIKPNASGGIQDTRWGGQTMKHWNDGMNLPTWNTELSCAFDLARQGASAAKIKKVCTRKR